MTAQTSTQFNFGSLLAIFAGGRASYKVDVPTLDLRG